jgi:5-(carboxyamino)imidazole ribonucleotide mutase
MDVLVILGSKSDLEKAKPCIDTLVEFKINHKLVIASAHRTPELLDETLKEAEKSVSVIILWLEWQHIFQV